MDIDNTSLSDFERGYKKGVLDTTATAYSDAFADLASERPLEITSVQKTVEPLQIGTELHALFHYLLKGYGVPLRSRNFIYVILCLSRDSRQIDNSFFLSDTTIEKIYGMTRNNCCAARKHLKVWQNGMLSSGLHNTRLVSIEDSSYNPRTKKAIKTKYTLNFLDLLSSLYAQVQQHAKYENKFLFAVQEVIDANKEKILEFGHHSNRKERQPRTWEKVEATLLKTFENLTSKILEMRRRNGIEPEQTEKDLTAILKTARSEMILGVHKSELEILVAREKENVRSIDRQQNSNQSNGKENRNETDTDDFRRAEFSRESEIKADLDKQRIKFAQKPEE